MSRTLCGQSASSMARRDVTLEDMRHYLIVILSTLAALAANLALDVYADVPKFLRWAVAVIVGLLVTLGLSRWPKRRQGRIDTDSPDRP